MDKILGNKKYIVLFVAPALCVFVVFGLAPILYNIYLSLYQTNLMNESKFVGLDNYLKLFKDQFFIKALINNLKFVCGCYVAHMGLALFLSHLLTQKKIRFGKVFQSIFFMPSVICGVAIGLLWKFIYNPEFGLLNGILNTLGLENWIHNWLADEKTVVPCLIAISMWQFVGYHMAIQIAAMREVDGNLYEAAEIDGANGWQKFTRVTLPLIKPVLAIDSVLIINGSLKMYDLIAVTTKGGPNHASEVLVTYMYTNAFKYMKFGYASTLAVALLVLCLLSTGVVNLIFQTGRSAED